MRTEVIRTDILIIGGGTAGTYAAITLGKRTDISAVIAEKADIRRSGCLAAGVNAINAYITKGHVPQDYVDYAAKDAAGIVREDLLLSISERFNRITENLEKMGLVILKDENGEYVSRGWRNIKINGENIKPLLAAEAARQKNVRVMNHVNITDLLLQDGCVAGAVGFSVREPLVYEFHARCVLVATGGASGLYRPNNPGFSRHKMWYPPFNTGAGYAMGIRAGAEMTTFEMRFIALRCKDTIAPTGTIAQGVHAKQVNAKGEVYEQKYGLTTSERVYGTVMENREGRGPCYLRTKGISTETEEDLYRAYLNMAPSQTLRWMESGQGPSDENVEIEGTEPYIVGGHTASGYWIGDDRMSTIPGLFAAGDVAGGAPQKYVTGALAEGEIAAESMLRYLDVPTRTVLVPLRTVLVGTSGTSAASAYTRHFTNPDFLMTTEEIEEAMQKVMDEYAGGISSDYQYNEAKLTLADGKISSLEALVPSLPARDMDDLLRIAELRDRLTVCHTLIAHLIARKETRWHSFGENSDFPGKDPAYELYINSRMENGKIRIIRRPLVKLRECQEGDEQSEHQDSK